MGLEPFKWEHLSTLFPGEADKALFNNDKISEESHSWAGNAVSVIKDGRTLAIGGVGMLYDREDPFAPQIANVWGFLSDEIRNYPFFLHRTVKRGLSDIQKELGLKRLQVIVRDDFEDGIKWAERLGFKKVDQDKGLTRMMKWL